jgi:hypothetical protein
MAYLVFMTAHRICLLAAWLAAGAGLEAQPQAAPITRVGMINVKPGRGGEWLSAFKKYEQPVLDKLLAEGTVLAWGVDVPLHHRKGFPSHNYWLAVPNYAALDKVNRARSAAMQKINAAERESLMALADPATHEDALLRTIRSNFKPVAAGVLPYTRIIMTRVQPGRGQEYLRLWQQYVTPVYEKLLTDNAILGYELMEQAENAMEPEWRWSLVLLPDLAAMDKVAAAFAAIDQKRAAERLSPLTGVFTDVTVGGSRRDWILRAVAYASK